MDVMDERDLARFELKMSFGRMSYIAQHPWSELPMPSQSRSMAEYANAYDVSQKKHSTHKD